MRALLNSVKVKPTEVLFSQVLYGIACIDCIDIACIDSFDIASLDCIDIASVDCIDIACIDCIDIASIDCIDIACIVTRNPPSSFSQDTGFANFSDGRWVAQTIREILSGQLDPASRGLY